MEKIKGITIKKLAIKLEKMGDLINYEGPILSHFISENNEDFLFFWVESDERCNRWLVYKTNTASLIQFFNQQTNHQHLIRATVDGFVYLIDIDNDLVYKNITIVSVEQIPENYLPSAASYYDPENYEAYAAQLKIYLDLHWSRITKFNVPDKLSSISLAMESDSPIYKKPI